MSNSIFRKDGTAQGVAKQRLIETLAKPGKRVIYDPFAANFVAGTSIMKLMGFKLSYWLTKKMAPGFHEHLISRTRFIDDLVENTAKEGIEQYVILGAGYDCRAHRLNLPSSLKIFEVDQPEVQKKKRLKLPKKVANSENMSYVSVDFNNQSLSDQLLEAGFDREKSTIFTLEGVSQYISKEAIGSTLNEICQLTENKKIIFYLSFVNENLTKNPKACFGSGYPMPEKKINMITKMAAKVGEPWISFYSNKEIEDMLSQNGFNLIQNKTLKDMNSLYFKPVERELSENQIFNLEHSVVAEKSDSL